MDARELMLGDWVIYDGDVEYINPIQIEGIDIATGSLITSDREDVGFDGVQPIPLTPEILEKNGFVFTDDGWTYCEDNKEKWHNYVFIKFRYNEEPRVVGINTVNVAECLFRNVRYVHELQHALRLCGIDKEIEL